LCGTDGPKPFNAMLFANWCLAQSGAERKSEGRKRMINRFQDNAANERTFLSWIRTAVTIAGFGIIIEKLQVNTDVIIGYILVASGALLVVLSTARFLVIRKQLTRKQSDDSRFAAIEIISALMLAALMAVILAFLSKVIF
jgi:putative membrane protein